MLNSYRLSFFQKTITFTLLLFFLTISNVHASIVHLISGRVIEGDIVLRDDELIKIDFGMGFPATYYLDEIDTIDGQSVIPDPKEEKTIITNEPEAEVSPEVTKIADEIDIVNVESAILDAKEEEPLIINEPEIVDTLKDSEPFSEVKQAEEAKPIQEIPPIKEAQSDKEVELIKIDELEKAVVISKKSEIPAKIVSTNNIATLEGVELFKKQPSPAAIKPKEAPLSVVSNDLKAQEFPRSIPAKKELNAPKKTAKRPTVTERTQSSSNFLGKIGSAMQSQLRGFSMKRARFQKNLTFIKKKLHDIPVKIRRSMLILLTIILTATYILVCLPLMLIAKKLGKNYTWLIWIPLVQVFYFVYMAGRSLWWAAFVLLPIFNILFPLFLFVDVLKALRKSVWLIAPILLPGANILTLWYLAFSKSSLDQDTTLRLQV